MQGSNFINMHWQQESSGDCSAGQQASGELEWGRGIQRAIMRGRQEAEKRLGFGRQFCLTDYFQRVGDNIYLDVRGSKTAGTLKTI